MKLYEVPRCTRIRVLSPDPLTPPAGLAAFVGDELHFDHIDGMYSFCLDDANNVVHLAAWTEVEIVE